MPGRKFNGGDYKYGFNGMELDNEVSGEGNSYTAMYWQYDSRLGRRWNIDPVYKYHLSNYGTFGNNPIIHTDPNGDDWWDVVVGYAVGIITNIVPVSTHAREIHSPTDPDDYNNALEGVDKAALMVGTSAVVAGGTGAAAGYTTAAVGGVLSLTEVGATVGAPAAAVGLAVGEAGTAVASGGAIVAANAVNNMSAGYNYGNGDEGGGSSGGEGSSSGGGNAPGDGNGTPRNTNRLGPDKDAGGDHTNFKRGDDGKVYKYETYEKTKSGHINPKKRYDGGKPDGTPGAPHRNKKTGERVPTPHVQGKKIEGGSRPARADEVPD